MSVTALAEYMILHADKQENILHDCRFARPPIVSANADALRALRAYNSNPRRDHSILEKVKAALTLRSLDLDVKPKTRDEAKRCIEAIELFERHENALGMRSMALRESPRFDHIDIEGVTISVQPDLLVDGGDDRVGAAFIRVAKAPDPLSCKQDGTRLRRNDHRREMAYYMVAIAQLLLEAQGHSFGKPDSELCFVADVRLGELVGPAGDHTARLRAIKGTCRQIVQLWPNIKPKKSVLAK
ncbi:hypothetical protein SS37A_33500 [Methylocystis iwaonis]|uniref:Uncharacterized protein n=2 Tax=Methylocystis iwaonis TaxID=2885079 RepID=A0ABN6VM84_9HYPH|nr:hypothetical protein SS37A_33500 [Methylocystis iwaonis]